MERGRDGEGERMERESGWGRREAGEGGRIKRRSDYL